MQVGDWVRVLPTPATLKIAKNNPQYSLLGRMGRIEFLYRDGLALVSIPSLIKTTGFVISSEHLMYCHGSKI